MSIYSRSGREREAHHRRRKEPMRVAGSWSLRRRISGTKLGKGGDERNHKTHLPSQTPELGGLDGKYMLNDTGGLQPSLQNVDCRSVSVGGKRREDTLPTIRWNVFLCCDPRNLVQVAVGLIR